jgi:hypothetical protein
MTRWSTIFGPLLLFALMLLLSPQANAQEGEEVEVDSDQGTMTVQKTVPVSVSVELNLNGQVYEVSLPATLNVDAQSILMNAVANEVERVGVLSWVVREIAESTEEFSVNDFMSIEVSSPDNKLVIVTSDVTNLDSEPQDPSYSSAAEIQGFDELGNLYEPDSTRACEELDPGETAPCTVVFDVPQDVTIVGLDLKVQDHKRLTLPSE